MQINSAYSPLSYLNTPYFFGAFILFSLLSGSLISTFVTIILSGISTYGFHHFMNHKLSIQSNEAILITGSGAGIGEDAGMYILHIQCE